LLRVDIDANEGLEVRAMNLTHAVLEYDTMRFVLVPVIPVLQTPPEPEVHVVMFCGLLFSPQQSCTAVVPGSDLNPAGQVWHPIDPVAFWNVSGGHVKHDVFATAS